MKPSTGLAVGLWVGAAAGLIVAAVYFHSGFSRGGDSSRLSDADLKAQAEKTKTLEAEKARLNAETKRLRQTIAELHSARPTGVSPSRPLIPKNAFEQSTRSSRPSAPAGPPTDQPPTVEASGPPAGPVPEGNDDRSTNTP